MASVTTSGPIPSPLITPILQFISVPLFALSASTDIYIIINHALQKYKEDILALNLSSTFSLSYTVADSGYFANDNLNYYDYTTYNFRADAYSKAQEVFYLYDLGVRAGLNVRDCIDDYHIETLFMYTYYFYKFADMVYDNTVSVTEINSIVNEMNSSTFEVYNLVKRFGSYYCKSTSNTAYWTLFTNASSGTYFYTVYQQYLSRI
jgi:hypothetical protein